MSTINWALDPTHSEVGFKIRHMMFSNVSGKFDEINATAVADGDSLEDAKISFTAKTSSINTGNADRDTHLKSADFFDAETNPEVTFESTSFKSIDDNTFELKGNLNMHGISNPVTLNVEFGGIGKDPWGNIKSAFSVTGKLNRKEWGLNWNAALEAGGVLVSDEVRIECEIQMVKQA